MSEIVNKVAKSGLITLDMKTFKGSQNRKIIDIKNWLYEGMVLKEKKFREHLEKLFKSKSAKKRKFSLKKKVSIKKSKKK